MINQKKSVKLPTAVRQVQIKKAAREIMRQQGISYLSFKNIARKCALSEGAIYRHFKNQNDLVVAILADMQTELLVPLQAIATGKESPPERLKRYMCFHINYIIKNGGSNLLLLSRTIYQNNHLLVKTPEQVFSLQKKYLCKIISDGIVQKIWRQEIPVEALSEFYMTIPLTLNLELIWDDVQYENNYFCLQMHSLIVKILSK